VERGFALTKLE